MTYTRTARALHWVMAILMLTMLGVGLLMGDITDPELKKTVYGLHKATGILVLALAIFRLMWRFSHAVPPLPLSLPRWQAMAAKAVHFGLYVVMFTLPLSGWTMSSAAGYPVSFYGLFMMPDFVAKNEGLRDFFNAVHEISANAFMVLLAAHVGAALYHHFVLRDNILRRMWRS